MRETYRANTTVTRNQFLDQDEDVVKALKDYIENRLPKEKVGILLYEEMPQEDGYELTVFYWWLRNMTKTLIATLTSVIV